MQHGLLQQFGCLALNESSLFHLCLDNLLGRRCQGLGIDGLAILADLSHILQVIKVVDIVCQHHQRDIGRLDGELGVVGTREVICHRDYVELHAALGHTIDRVVYIAVEGKVVGAHAQLGSRIDAAKERLFNALDNQGSIYRRLANGARDILLLVGEEVVRIALTCHVVLAHQTVERFLDAVLKSSLVNIHAIDHKDGDVLNVGLDVVDVADQIQQL